MNEKELMRHKKEVLAMEIPTCQEIEGFSLWKLEELILSLFKEFKSKNLFSKIIEDMEVGWLEIQRKSATKRRAYILAIIDNLNLLIFDLWDAEEVEA